MKKQKDIEMLKFIKRKRAQFKQAFDTEKKDFNVKVKWKLLESIADFYQFPVAVFLGKTKPKGKRIDHLTAKADKFDRIREICE